MIFLYTLIAFIAKAKAQSDAVLNECTELIWSVDNNSFTHDEYTINLNGPDMFTYVDESRFSTGAYPTYQVLLAGLNPQLGEEDPDMTPEIDAYLDALMDTPPMQTAHDCLVDWARASADIEEFKEELSTWWFGKYSRSSTGVLDSSGFEHVFQGELSEDGTSARGFHNWVQTYQEERDGYLIYNTSNNDCRDQGVGDLVEINRYKWRDADKIHSYLWIGTSVELEMALYTVCFRSRYNEDCFLEVNGGNTVQLNNYGVDGTEFIGGLHPICTETNK